MEIKERVKRILEEKNLSGREFERISGLGTSYLQNMGKKPQPHKLGAILKAFPDINPEWLRTGRGDMYKKQETNVTQQGHHNQYAGRDIRTYSGEADVMEEIREHRRLLEKALAQTERLIKIIEELARK